MPTLAELRALAVAPTPAPGQGLALGPDGLIPPRLLTKPAATVFPPLPVDGQEYVYAADTANGVFWRFRWYAIGAYWAFTGGAPLSARVDTRESTTSTTYADLATVGPSIALPFAADYTVTWGCRIDATGVGDQLNIGLTATGHAASDADSIELAYPGTGFYSTARSIPVSAISGTLKLQYKTNADTGFFKYRWLSVTPVKK